MSHLLRAKDFPKLHQPDPTGEWHLIRTGEKLPEIGQQIQFVYDIRGCRAESRRKLLQRVADGDEYRITNEAKGPLLGGTPGLIMAEMFKLPTKDFEPEVRVGHANGLIFDKACGDWYLEILGFNGDIECIVYWRPLASLPLNLHTPRDDDHDLWMFDHAYRRDEIIQERWECRNYKEPA